MVCLELWALRPETGLFRVPKLCIECLLRTDLNPAASFATPPLSELLLPGMVVKLKCYFELYIMSFRNQRHSLFVPKVLHQLLYL